MPTGPIALRQDWLHTDGAGHARLVDSYDVAEGVTKMAMLSWDTDSLAWVRFTGGGGGVGGAGDASAANQTTEIAKLEAIRTAVVGTLAVSGPLTDTQLRASAVPVSGPLTNTQLRAADVSVAVTNRASATLYDNFNVPINVGGAGGLYVEVQSMPATAATANNQTTGNAALGTSTDAEAAGNGSIIAILKRLRTLLSGTLAVSGPLTNTELRAAVVPVSDGAGSLTVDAPVGTPAFVRLSDGAAPIATLPVSGPLTDTQIRATALPVSGPLTDTQIRATALPVSGPLTDAQLRAVAVPISAATLPLPTNAATDAGLAALLVELLLKARLTDTQPVSAAPLNTAQGTIGTNVVGPMVQALADDTPPFLTPGSVFPLSLSSDGRLRVIAAPSTSDTDFWPDPFDALLFDDRFAFTPPAVSFF